ncbi:helix-turn-helix domain-containing protein [Sulfurimonas sp. HSL-3221]|uniref:helix-turn-helix domain-containing protein n=1 Tax=Sulfurimonadaceae TaxID=2771471 RepID=UPI001E2D4BBC|nr:helix-turn-helix domain-containing protein [Sulfurimonas sp. HSL-3221]UFS61818.1 helix-turn-helix domain-containing protein [Sulfurimonas sp. HSL-3221]
MKVDFESLERLPLIEKKLDHMINLLESKQQKRWLSSKEAAHYMGYSADTIRKLIKNGDLQEGIHYHQRYRKLVFDSVALDRWLMGIEEDESPAEIDGIISEIIAEVKSDAS